MPCFYPLQAYFVVNESGKREYFLSKNRGQYDAEAQRTVHQDSAVAFPCGRCIGCRLERSRQWAVRMMHEAKMYDDNCFITLTYDDDHLPSNLSLDKRELQLFMKRLRQTFKDQKIRFFGCGEYGDDFSRPHYHVCLFGFDFKDKILHSVKDDKKYFTSEALSKIWTYGFSLITDLTFDSAAYVARYCTKKISGSEAEEHYCGREPEFALMSRKPGLGAPWLEKYGQTDCWTHDEVVVNGVRCKSPRYYDIKLEQLDARKFAAFKEARRLKALEKSEDNSWSRLKVKEKCAKAKFKRLSREFETN